MPYYPDYVSLIINWLGFQIFSQFINIQIPICIFNFNFRKRKKENRFGGTLARRIGHKRVSQTSPGFQKETLPDANFQHSPFGMQFYQISRENRSQIILSKAHNNIFQFSI